MKKGAPIRRRRGSRIAGGEDLVAREDLGPLRGALSGVAWARSGPRPKASHQLSTLASLSALAVTSSETPRSPIRTAVISDT